MSEIVVEATPREEIPLTLVGVKYTIVPPKSNFALKMAYQAKTSKDDPTQVVDSLFDWVRKAFRDQADAVLARLDDDGDDLDIDHLTQLMQKVLERGSGGNPTT